ncbi:coiled-coil domain-containing protein [Pelobacter propionicus]|nr:hypothetical protein [Pelobacter propionicus]
MALEKELAVLKGELTGNKREVERQRVQISHERQEKEQLNLEKEKLLREREQLIIEKERLTQEMERASQEMGKEKEQLKENLLELGAKNAYMSELITAHSLNIKTIQEYEGETSKFKRLLEDAEKDHSRKLLEYSDARSGIEAELRSLYESVKTSKAELEKARDDVSAQTLVLAGLQRESSRAEHELNTLKADTEKEASLLDNLQQKKKELDGAISDLTGQKKNALSDALSAQQQLDKIQVSLEKMSGLHENETVFAILENDLRSGFVSSFAPDLFKRLYRHDKKRARSLFLELWARYPEPKNFRFDPESLRLEIDGTPTEQLFAAIAAERCGESGSPDRFLEAWENFIDVE